MRVRTRRSATGVDINAPVLYKSMKARVGFGVNREIGKILCPDCSTPEIVIDYFGEPVIKPSVSFMLEYDLDWKLVKIIHDPTCPRSADDNQRLGKSRQKKTTR